MLKSSSQEQSVQEKTGKCEPTTANLSSFPLLRTSPGPHIAVPIQAQRQKSARRPEFSSRHCPNPPETLDRAASSPMRPKSRGFWPDQAPMGWYERCTRPRLRCCWTNPSPPPPKRHTTAIKVHVQSRATCREKKGHGSLITSILREYLQG